MALTDHDTAPEAKAAAPPFLSDAWIKALHHVAQELLDQGSDASACSYAEIFTGVPGDAVPEATINGVTGYVLSFGEGRVSVRRADRADEPVDCVVTVDYATALATMTARSGPALNELSRKAFGECLMTMTGSPQGLPISMNSLHDALVDIGIA